jgi:3-oxoadipate enol-lactonase/4-carboxymuconolactone decarboxylase
VPTLVLVGSDDQVTGPAEARTLVAGIPDARLAVVPGASHLVPVEQPAAVTDLLVRHFSTAWQPAYDTGSGQIALSAAPVKPVLIAPQLITPIAEIAPPVPQPEAQGRPDQYDAGMKVRREVLGDAHVDRALTQADEFSGDFQDFITRYAWGEIWNRPGLDRRSRSCVTLTALVAGGHLDELAFHTRAALRNGLTPVEIKEVLLQAAVYCGVPAANSAFKVAQQVIREETTPEG